MYKWDSSKRKVVEQMRDLAKEIIDQLDKASDNMYCGFLDTTEYDCFQGNLNIAHDKARELLSVLYDEIKIGESKDPDEEDNNGSSSSNSVELPY